MAEEGGVPGTRVQLQVRPRAQVASPPAPRATEPPRIPPGRRGAARGDKDDRPPRDPAGQHGGRRPRGTGPRARAGPRSGGQASRRGRGGRGTPLRSASLRVAGLRAPPPFPRPGGGGVAYLGRLADLEQVQPVGVPVVNDVGQLPPLLVAAARRHGRGRFSSSSSSSSSRAAGPEHRRPPRPPQRPPPPLPSPPARPPPGSARVRPAPPPSARLSRGRCAERRPPPRPPPCAPAVRVPVRVRAAHLGAAPLGAAAWPRARGWGWRGGARRESARSVPGAAVRSPRAHGVPDRSGWVPTGATGFYEHAGSALSRLRCGGLPGGAAS